MYDSTPWNYLLCMCRTSHDTNSSQGSKTLTSSSTTCWQSKKHGLKGKHRQGCNLGGKKKSAYSKVQKRQSRNSSSSFVHKPPPTDQKTPVLRVCSWTGDFHGRANYPKAQWIILFYWICRCHSLHQQDVRSITPFPRYVIHGSLALLL